MVTFEECMTCTVAALLDDSIMLLTVTPVTPFSTSAGCPLPALVGRIQAWSPMPTIEMFEVVTVTGASEKYPVEPSTSTVSPATAAFTASWMLQYGLVCVPFPVSVVHVTAEEA